MTRIINGTFIGSLNPFEIGKGLVVRDGSDVTLVATGPILKVVIEAAARLAAQGTAARVIAMPTVKPLDCGLIAAAATETGAIVTVEEHNVFGGLGSAVCETVCACKPVVVLRVGIPDRFGESGAYPEILRRAGLDAEHVTQTAQRAIELKAGT